MFRALGRRGPGPHRALHRRARGRPRRGHDPHPGRRPRLVLLRRLLDREARRPRLQRRAVGDDPARARPGRRRLRPARHHRHPRRRRQPRRADPVQGRHRRRGRRVRRRVGPAREPPALQGVQPSTWRAGAERPMLTLYVDEDRWRTHLAGPWSTPCPASCRSRRATATASGNRRLAEVAEQLERRHPRGRDVRRGRGGRPTRFTGSLLVLTPWRAVRAASTYGPRLVHTVGRLEDLAGARRRGPPRASRPGSCSS